MTPDGPPVECQALAMGRQFDDLPEWEFTIVEISVGVDRVKAVRNGGITGEGSGTDPETTLEDLRIWARRVEDGLPRT